ncbi:MAG: ParA family protein [Pseudobdellovibrionaceae bacterium]|nr:ParA family protein [Pseudobdellovibrionaceae bacterium]
MSSASIVTIGNEKGGVGKTTTVVNLASAFALLGKKVLVVDFDSQANSSAQLGADMGLISSGRNLKAAIESDLTIPDIRIPTNTEGVHLLPALKAMDELKEKVIGQPNQFKLLELILDCPEKNEYDVILVDTHPAKDCYFQSAMAASHYYLVPLFAEADPVTGLADLITDVEKIRRYLNPMLVFIGCVVTKYNKTSATHVLYEKVLRKSSKAAKFHVFDTVIPDSQSVAAASAKSLPLHMYRRNSPAAVSYMALAGEILPYLKGQRTGRKMAPVNVKALEETIGSDLETQVEL